MAVDLETLQELINDAVEARIEAAAQADAAAITLKAALSRVAEMKAEEDSFRQVLARRFPDQVSSSSGKAESNEISEKMLDEILSMPTHDSSSWASFPRSTAVEMAIRDITGSAASASPADIESYLKTKGRDDSRDNIGAALAHLNRSDRVRSVGRAQWILSSAV